jgi:AraC-like DNA-binding protein
VKRPRVHGRLGVVPTATGGITRLAYAQAKREGVELRLLLDKAGLTFYQVHDRGVRLGVRHQIQFLNLVAAALRDEFLGFHLAQSVDLRELGLLYYAAASSDSLGDALERAARYCSIVNEGLSLKIIRGDSCTVSFNYVGVARHLDRHQIEFCMIALIRLCRQLTGVNLMASRVRLAHLRTGERSGIAAYFGGKVEFAADNDELMFPARVDRLTVVSSDPYLSELLIKYCDEAISKRGANQSSLQSAVENAIVPLLPHGRARADEIAKRLGMAQRTLARRLASEGLTFSKALEGLRTDLAMQYLGDRKLSISRIAWLLGYQEVSAFTHAFRCWKGQTPRQARAGQELVRG